MTTATETLNKIIQHDCYDSKTKRVFPQVDEFVAQGDLNFLAIAEIPKGMMLQPAPKQLAKGATRGSRHCLSDPSTVNYYQWPNPNPLEGGALECLLETEIEHPEHGNLIFPAGTLLAIGYQRKHADEIRRSQD